MWQRLAVLIVAGGAVTFGGTVAAGQDPPVDQTLPSTPPTAAPTTTVPGQRQWPVAVPAGCTAPPLPDVVFIGTLVAAVPATARFRVDQVRAGAMERYASNGLVDVDYGIDTKYLETGQRYLVGASVDVATARLTSKIRAPEPLFGGDEVIGARESDVECPVLADPTRTLTVDGRSVDSSLFKPFVEADNDLLRAALLPLGTALAVIFGLVALRWTITGVGKGVGVAYRSARVPREVRAVMRTNLRARQPE